MCRIKFWKSMALLTMVIIGLILNCSTPQTVSVQPNANSGIALLKIAVIPNSPFQKIAKTAILTISASDMLSMTKSLTITDSSVEGKVSGIPVGKNRLFEVSVFDSLDTLQYQGSATSDVISDSMVTVFISVKRITSSANINGNIIEDTTNSIGYRYYKFVVNASNIGSSPGAAEDVSILTETHFLKGSVAYPPAGNYSIVSDSSVEAGSVAALFDGDSATDSTGNYMKFTLAPWAWVIDMKQNYTFDNFYLSSWQTYWYREPSDIAIYGANSSSGPWKQIGAEVFTAVYQAAVVPLVY